MFTYIYTLATNNYFEKNKQFSNVKYPSIDYHLLFTAKFRQFQVHCTTIQLKYPTSCQIT